MLDHLDITQYYQYYVIQYIQALLRNFLYNKATIVWLNRFLDKDKRLSFCGHKLVGFLNYNIFPQCLKYSQHLIYFFENWNFQYLMVTNWCHRKLNWISDFLCFYHLIPGPLPPAHVGYCPGTHKLSRLQYHRLFFKRHSTSSTLPESLSAKFVMRK